MKFTLTIELGNEAMQSVKELGYYAATCDVMAWGPNTTEWERRGLERRAARYRALQLEALERLEAMKPEGTQL